MSFNCPWLKEIPDCPGNSIVALKKSARTIGYVSKQFFVAIDKGESYTDENKIPEIIKETTRLKLLPGHELFGRAWNEKTPEVKTLPEPIETNSEDN